MPVITVQEVQDLIPKLKSKTGERLVRGALHIASLDRVNDLYDRNCHLQGADFADALLRNIGIMLVDLFGHLRADYKVMVNEILARIRAMGVHFINVTPKGNEETGPKATSLGGIREAISPEAQDACQTAEELGEMLRRAVYEMPMPGSFLPRSKCRL